MSKTPLLTATEKEHALPATDYKSMAGDDGGSGAASTRLVYACDTARNAEFEYRNNTVTTSKYTAANFLFKFLFEQFRRLANAYFLLVSILQLFDAISTTNGLPTSAPPLLFVITVEAVATAYEDYQRHKADREANSRMSLVLNTDSGEFEARHWYDIVVGDVVKVLNRESSPADVLLLASSDNPPAGICYVETKSLDGETNLKLRQAPQETVDLIHSDADAARFRGEVECEMPNVYIDKFTGTMLPASGEERVPLAPKNMLLRGCTLRNTDFVYGLVINTGHDTKIMMSATESRTKTSSINQAINREILHIVALLAGCCLLGATVSGVWTAANSNADYLDLTQYQWDSFILKALNFFLLIKEFIPVSLYVSMSLIHTAQTYFMQKDVAMYHEETDTPMKVRTMNLNEELGQVEYIFSDKTGTLTCNIMEFRKCSINGISYGLGFTEIGLAALRRAGKEVPESALKPRPADAPGRAPYVNFEDDPDCSLYAAIEGGAERKMVHAFMKHLAVCHTVIPERVEGGELRLSASSPDEQALVAGASHFGFGFTGRAPGRVIIDVPGGSEEYTVLDVLEFNSTRKRMTVIVRCPDGRIRVLCKGADAVMYPRLKTDTAEAKERAQATMEHMEAYAGDGLRTLVIATADLSASRYEEWARRYHAAAADMEELEKRKRKEPNAIDDLQDEVEQGLTLLGATAIEDKLQDGVPGCIADLAKAGIKIWVLTGDKRETAINIGFACRLLTEEMKRVVISSDDFHDEESIRDVLDREAAKVEDADKPLAPRALVIDGNSLNHALLPSCAPSLLRFARLCKAVVCCRVSPKQKALMVGLVKDNIAGVKTLAIGDGANDVSMITTAHIGVGISGQEGMQAVNASDYAIAQFRFLQRLLLVHGHWNYRRVCKLVCYMFYKNILLVLAQFWFTLFYNGASGQKFYNEIGVQLFNLFYTSMPILLLGTLDQDVRAPMLLKYPSLFGQGIRDYHFNPKVFWGWLAEGFFQSVVITVIPVWSMSHVGTDGHQPGIWALGATSLTLVVIIANVKVALETYTWHWLNHLFFWGSILVYLLSNYAFQVLDNTFTDVWDYLMSEPSFWFAMILGCTCCLINVVVWKVMKRLYFPEDYHIVQEIDYKNMEAVPLKSEERELIEPADVELDIEEEDEEGKAEESGSPKKSDALSRWKKKSKAITAFSRRRHTGFAFSTDPDAQASQVKLLTVGPEFWTSAPERGRSKSVHPRVRRSGSASERKAEA